LPKMSDDHNLIERHDFSSPVALRAEGSGLDTEFLFSNSHHSTRLLTRHHRAALVLHRPDMHRTSVSDNPRIRVYPYHYAIPPATATRCFPSIEKIKAKF
jgi:hypothetical protein